jgi:hypothetical protein
VPLSEVYEVRCESCQSSFAPGTKNCVHCGRRIGGGLMAALGQGRSDASPAMEETAPEPFGEEEQLQVPTRGKGMIWMVLLAMIASALRFCTEG